MINLDVSKNKNAKYIRKSKWKNARQQSDIVGSKKYQRIFSFLLLTNLSLLTFTKIKIMQFCAYMLWAEPQGERSLRYNSYFKMLNCISENQHKKYYLTFHQLLNGCNFSFKIFTTLYFLINAFSFFHLFFRTSSLIQL